MNAAVYARYSSDNQNDQSIDAQLNAIHDYAEYSGAGYTTCPVIGNRHSV